LIWLVPFSQNRINVDVIPACKALPDDLTVTDIDIQEVPIEDVIRQIFAR
jgi:hypothetical protein